MLSTVTPAEIVFLQKRTVSLLMRQEAVPLNYINNSSTVHLSGHCDPGELLFYRLRLAVTVEHSVKTCSFVLLVMVKGNKKI